MKAVATSVLATFLALILPQSSQAADLLGLYVGGSVGQAHVRNENRSAGVPWLLPFNRSSTGWKAFVGLRLLPFLSFELAYTDFGTVSGGPPIPPIAVAYFSDRAQQRAETLSAVGYLPLPLPYLSLFGKLGTAHLQTNTDVRSEPFMRGCSVYLITCTSSTESRNQWGTDLAYGAGVQWKVSALAVRIEYERINDTYGDPDLLSVGVAWTF